MLKPRNIPRSSDEPTGVSTETTSKAISDNLGLPEGILKRKKVWKDICKKTGVDESSITIGDTIKIQGVGDFKLNDEKYIVQCREDWSMFSIDDYTGETIEENLIESNNGGYVPGAPSYELWEKFIVYVRQIGQGDEGGELVEKFLNEVMNMKSRTDRGNWSVYASGSMSHNLMVTPDTLGDNILWMEILDNCLVYNVRLLG